MSHSEQAIEAAAEALSEALYREGVILEPPALARAIGRDVLERADAVGSGPAEEPDSYDAAELTAVRAVLPDDFYPSLAPHVRVGYMAERIGALDRQNRENQQTVVACMTAATETAQRAEELAVALLDIDSATEGWSYGLAYTMVEKIRLISRGALARWDAAQGDAR